MLNHNPHQFAKDGYCMYRDGDGVTQDYDEALKWFSKAAEGAGWLRIVGEGNTRRYKLK
jgi:hypothetical protein